MSQDGTLNTDRRDGRVSGVMPYAVDPKSAERLWAVSEELTGTRFPD